MKQFISEIEITLIENVMEVLTADECQPVVATDYLEFLNAVLSGQYESVLSHQLSQQILHLEGNDGTDPDAISKQLEENVKRFVSCDSEDEALLRQLVVLIVAVSCLQVFVQNNWVGPPTKLDPVSLICVEKTTLRDSCLHDFASNYLSVDGEPIYPLCTGSLLLVLARILLSDCGCYITNCKTRSLWLMRCLQTQQALIEERSPSLKSAILEIISSLNDNDLFRSDRSYRQLAMQFHLEAGHLLYFYYEDIKAHEHFNQAKALSELTIELKGALGKRTKFQQKDYSQLALQVRREEEDQLENDQKPSKCELSQLPKNCALDDDALLENIQFTEPDEIVVASMSAVEQAMVLGLCHHHRKTHEGQGGIVQEESLAFINCVLGQPCNWSVQSKALLMRVRWETETSRQIQRSLTQLEELVTQFNRTDVPGFKRLALVYAVSLPPRWVTEHLLGNHLMNIGATASALEVFTRLEMWEDVIKCYVILGHKNDAEKLIRAQIAVKESSTLWCYLGDVTHNPEDYLRAWDLSKGCSSRAQRSLGYLCIRNHELEKSLPYFEKSLEINPLQIGVWFSYGCACLSCAEYEKAAKGFRRCVNLNSDNFEAWNNLATAYIRAHNKPRAFLTLQEAIRCDYENWRIWENYLVVSVDVGEFEESIRAYHRLLELRQKHSDAQVLRILVRAINEDLLDSGGQSSSRLRPKALKLFGHVTAVVTNNAEIWQLYAQLQLGGSKEEMSQTDIERAMQYLQKSYRFYTLDSHWDSDLEKCKEVCEQFVKLTQLYEGGLMRLDNGTQKSQMVASARMSIRALISRVEKNFLDLVTNELPKDLAEPIGFLEKSVQKFLDMSK